MCFITNNIKRETATKDITCHKVLEEKDGLFEGWITGYEYETGVKQPHVDLVALQVPGDSYYTVDEGYHSFKKGRKKAREYWNSSINPVRAKCIIPKGAEYLYSEEHKKYVSSTIIIKEIIK